MRGPLNKVDVHKAPCPKFGVHFHQHVGIGVIPRGSHRVVLRPVVVRIVDPFVDVTRNNKLNCVQILAKKRKESVVSKLGRLLLS